ncbi:MAG TPA: hypothetical protein VF868_02965 [Bacteroidia bacterium]|jgi:hypothetical protein
MVLKKIQLSGIAILIVALTCLILDYNFKNWQKQDRVIEHDVHWYYSYLPAKFIYDDIKLEKSDYRFDDNYYLFWPVYTTDGKKLIKTTMGLSVMYAPFFFTGHLAAKLLSYDLNGFSAPYKIALLISAIFYLCIGLHFIRKILFRLHLSDLTIAITILIVGLGTNLLCYSSLSAPMPHTYNFCLIAVFVYLTVVWHENPSGKLSIVIGIILGLITLIRPSNLIVSVFFLLYNVNSPESFKQKLSFFKKEYFILNLIFYCVALTWIPQCIYWNITTGNFLFYSYGDERFFFGSPHIVEGLFGFRKGWLIYTPIMGFALFGLFIKNRALQKFRTSIILFLILNIYIIFSWWCWWYGGTFGQRSMIDCYPILCIPLAFFVNFILRIPRKAFTVAFAVTCLFLTWLNIFQTIQFEKQTLHWEGMTRELYFRQFGKLAKIDNYKDYLDLPNYDAAKKGSINDTLEKVPPERLTIGGKSEKSRQTIFLRSYNGKYLCVQTGSNTVSADKINPGDQEALELIDFGDGRHSIRAKSQKFFCAELQLNNEITASRNTIGDWETFTLVKLRDNTVAFKAANNKYVSADSATAVLFAKKDSVDNSAMFTIIQDY